MRSSGSYPAGLNRWLKVPIGHPGANLRYLLLGCAIVAASYSFLLARAAWLFGRDTQDSVGRAVHLVPSNSAYVARLAAWLPPQRTALLKRAVQLNPFDSDSLIQLGLESEFGGHNLAAAERYYLQAFTVNKMFLPKWTLTNFYFRQGQRGEFFRWAAQTLAITPYSPDPVFQQMWLMSQNSQEIAKWIPDRPRILLPYAWFLSNSGRYQAIAPAVHRLVRSVGARNPWAWGRDDLIATMLDRLVAEDHRDAALEIWSSMVEGRWLNKQIPTPEHPLTNGTFQTLFFRHGFDWVPSNSDCARVEQFPSRGDVHLVFSGNQAETCAVMEQSIPLQPNRSYQLSWAVEPGLADSLSGLQWSIEPAQDKSGLEELSADLLASDPARWIFRSPPETGVGVLTLRYSRPLGHLRLRGTVVLKSVSLALS